MPARSPWPRACRGRPATASGRRACCGRSATASGRCACCSTPGPCGLRRSGRRCGAATPWSARSAATPPCSNCRRRDTALFELPPPPRAPGTRGRPRLYGERIDAAAVARLPASCHRIAGCGGRAARLRHVLCRPRFLRGVVVRAVWCELQKRGGGWAKQRLLPSTDPALSAVAIAEAYANRWTVEPLFAALKLSDG